VPATLVLFESPKRIHETFGDLVQIAGDGRRAALCRELTKRFEEVIRGTLGELRAALDGPLRERRDRPVRLVFFEGDER